MTGIEIRDLAPGDAEWVIEQHARHYTEEDGFDSTFGALVAEILAAYIRNHDTRRERAFIAHRDGHRLGSMFCVQGDSLEIAKLRLFLVLPDARGQGLGKRLLSECLAFARASGYRRMRLWTHESHKAACALYASAGFFLTASTPVTNFGVDLVEQVWERDLSDLP